MTHHITKCCRFAAYAVLGVLVLFALRMPAAQGVIVGGLVGFADFTERLVRFPCGLLDHSRCFSLDRFDPTCPQCV